MQAQNTCRSTFFPVKDPSEDSTLDGVIGATCNNMTEASVNSKDNPISDLNPSTVKSWTERIACHLRVLPENTIHVIFDDYDRGPLCLSKGRLNSGRGRFLILVRNYHS